MRAFGKEFSRESFLRPSDCYMRLIRLLRFSMAGGIVIIDRIVRSVPDG